MTIDSGQKLEATKLGNLSPEATALIQRRRQTAQPSTAHGPMPRDASVAPLPLSFEQQSLWFIDRLSPGLAAYHIPLAVRITGSLDVSALRWALDALVIRHESLRTNFDLADGMPIQVVGTPRPVPLRETDLTNCPDDQRESELRLILEDEVRRPFDLARDILLRGVNVRLGAQEHVLRLVIHHIVTADGWSIGILLPLKRSLPSSIAPLRRAKHHRLPLCPSSSQISPSGNGSSCRARPSRRKSLFGGDISKELRTLWPCPPTGRGRRCLPFEARARHISAGESLTRRLRGHWLLAVKTCPLLFMTLLAAFEVLIARLTRDRG